MLPTMINIGEQLGLRTVQRMDMDGEELGPGSGSGSGPGTELEERLPMAPGGQTEGRDEAEVRRRRQRKIWSPDGYAGKKTVAQGMMDVALITSNANQLRFVLDYGRPSSGFHIVVTLIVISLLLQVAVGVALIFKGRADSAGESRLERANRLNNCVVASVFVITVINVFIGAFSTPGERPLDRSTGV